MCQTLSFTYLEGGLDAAEGRGVTALVGMDVTDQAEVRALEEAELLLNGLACRQFGPGQGRELLTCYFCMCRIRMNMKRFRDYHQHVAEQN